MADQSPPVVVIIAGPTAAGKSDVAARICARQKGMIISADSVQAYRGVQIGANKPSIEERKETPHILVDVADRVENYNAAEWREDAIFCIQLLLGRSNKEEEESATTPAADSNRRNEIQEYIQEARIDKGYCGGDEGQQQVEKILPVVCGGTMMYLQWLVRGRPDAMRPTPKAVEISYKVIQEFQDNDNDYGGAVKHVASFDKVFAERAEQLTTGDWYRLRRTLEIALTVEEEKQKAKDENDSSSRVDNLVEQLYSGQREGSLASLGYDVRCFFLCPDDRMSHTRVVDKRCEQMLMKGLLNETTELSLAGRLPEMAERAIGYRQTLDYLNREHTQDEKAEEATSIITTAEKDAFEFYLHEFTTATRRYAKKQMAWFRKDKEFMFIPVSLKLNKSDRVDAAANAINRLCQLSREDYESELLGGDEFLSGKTKRENEAQGKTMKFYTPERHILTPGSKEYESVLTEELNAENESARIMIKSEVGKIRQVKA
eukprot:CAMPEP_0168234852 /NCGR_PEP_ID=MMETSP0140_2-20121125/18499_1 /TAXON_ID=44445 /ORGANISM="Pseudo-nitzschia australis, Strain 10249 10 AB" /LENGTH=488 /DNA_ID=CAMNT_0008167697 /DNA_START=359 /DNA_END=1823 /DNA_ORIENTATION=-